jgi:hypothetical protein
MSTGCNCEFLEVQPGRWFYVLEDYDAPKNAWDWHDNATAYGPFASEALAEQHLHANHANPGGSSTLPYREGYQPSETLTRLIAEATSRRRPQPFRFNRGRF